jgi:hypothetical protein
MGEKRGSFRLNRHQNRINVSPSGVLFEAPK